VAGILHLETTERARLPLHHRARQQLTAWLDITVNPAESGFILFQQSTGNFFTVGLSVPSNVTFTSATYDVDSIIGNTFSLVSYAPIIQTYVALAGTRSVDLDVTLPATTQLYVLVNNTGQPGYNVTFQISGSLQTPIPLGNGGVILALSDGNQLYVIQPDNCWILLCRRRLCRSSIFLVYQRYKHGHVLSRYQCVRING